MTSLIHRLPNHLAVAGATPEKKAKALKSFFFLKKEDSSLSNKVKKSTESILELDKITNKRFQKK